jgi:ComF family protein
MNIREALRHIFFPPRCAPCGKIIARGAICDDCRKTINIDRTLFCGTCRARLPSAQTTCHKNAPYILAAPGNYDNAALRELIHALKFRRARDAAEPIGEIIARYLQNLTIDLSRYVIIPVPLSSRRRRERGFNQSELIGKILFTQTGIPMRIDILKRTRHTSPQSETENIGERRRNVEHAFRIVRPPPPHIILLDDVTTSGSTFREAARALRESGARKIIGLATAKA